MFLLHMLTLMWEDPYYGIMWNISNANATSSYEQCDELLLGNCDLCGQTCNLEKNRENTLIWLPPTRPIVLSVERKKLFSMVVTGSCPNSLSWMFCLITIVQSATHRLYQSWMLFQDFLQANHESGRGKLALSFQNNFTFICFYWSFSLSK